MKLYIVGAVASGKSTLAKKLSDRLKIPYCSLDGIVHISDGTSPWGNRKREVMERDSLFNKIMQQNEWIIEDTGRPCFEAAFRQAEVIILLEIPKQIRNYRILKRWIKQRLGIEKCNYNPNINMLKCMFKWSKDYDSGKDNLKGRVGHYQAKMIILKNKRDIKKFLVNTHRRFNSILPQDAYDLPERL